MPAFIVASSFRSNGIKQVHLTSDTGEHPQEILMNVTPKTFPEEFLEGELWSVEVMRLRAAPKPERD